MSDKLTQNLTHLSSVDTANDRIPIYDASDPTELKYSTPDEIAPTVPDASTTVKGKVELAIGSEVTTGTDDTRAVTPKALADAGITAVSGSDFLVNQIFS